MKKIRRNFIVIAMLSMFLVLSVIITALNYINYQKMEKALDDVTRILEIGNGSFYESPDHLRRTTTLRSIPIRKKIIQRLITKCRSHRKAYRKKPLIKPVISRYATMLPAQYMPLLSDTFPLSMPRRHDPTLPKYTTRHRVPVLSTFTAIEP